MGMFSKSSDKNLDLQLKGTNKSFFIFADKNTVLKNIPIKLAEWMSEVSVKNKFIPIIYLVAFFFALPLFIILIGR